MNSTTTKPLRSLAAALTLAACALANAATQTTGPVTGIHHLEKAPGFNGIWYMNQPSKDEYKYKYSGGFATYPQQHAPLAIYRPEVEKTFFVYGGSEPGKQNLLHMISCYDHKTGKVARPRILLDKHTDDAHDNPVIAMDDAGYITVFSPSHGTARGSYLSRSLRPYDIDDFDTTRTFNFSYPQPRYISGKGYVFFHTRYAGGRTLNFITSQDGIHWDKNTLLARIDEGHYQISNARPDGSLATAFNYHPKPGGLNARTNLYYMETLDVGKSWRTADGRPVPLPVKTTDTVCLVHDYQREGLLVYLKDLQFDAEGHPVILYITSRGYASGPANDPRTWRTARFTGTQWDIHDVTTSTNNYDYGPLYIEKDGTWRIIAPTADGPQSYNPGGELDVWISKDQGTTWTHEKALTRGSKFNHTFVRRPLNASSDFYALWADGNARQPSDSSLYFTNQSTSAIWKLPHLMTEDWATPELLPLPK